MAEPVPGTPRLLRALNDRAALDLLVSHGPLTRARLGELTGLSKVTASQLLGRLEQAGLVHEVGEETGARGPNARLYAVDGATGLAVGLDLDPHRGIARVVDAAGTTLGEATVQLPRAAGSHDPGRDVHRILEAVTAAARTDGRAFGSVAVGVQGAYDPGLDALTYAAHLPAWSRPGLKAALATAAGCPVTIENDVNLAAAADASDREAPDRGSSAYFWLGDGLRMAIHFNGVLYRGAHGGAGEVGYIPVAGPSGRLPLQDLVGAPAVAALARTHGVPGPSAADAVAWAVSTDARADARGDALAAGFLAVLAERISTGLATVAAVLDPDEVVLGGPVGTAGGDRLAALVVTRLHQTSPMRPRVRPAVRSANPVLTGACAQALRDLREQLFTSTTTGTATGGATARTGAKP